MRSTVWHAVRAGRPRGRRGATAARICLAALVALAGCDQFAVYPLLDGTPVLRPARITIAAGATAELEIAGGRPPYRATVTPAGGKVVLSGARVEYTPGEPGQSVIRVRDDLGSEAEAWVFVGDP